MCSTRRALKNARSTASTKGSGCSTSTPTSAWTAAPASRSARSRRSSTRTTCLTSGRTTTRPTSSFLPTSAHRAVHQRPARSTRITRSWLPCHPRRPSTKTAVAATDWLPDFPWDSLAAATELARAHPGGLVDLSVGTPVDPVPDTVQAALREAAAGWLSRRHGVAADPAAVLPVIGTKEFIAWLPTLLRCGQGDVVVYPELAYPTYDVGARLAGATPIAADGLVALGPRRVALAWLNSPSNPTGRVLPPEHLRKVVGWARDRDTVVASDECYIELGWEAEPVSVLHPDVCEGSHRGLLAVHSLSKRSNMAGYRAGFVTGDPALIAQLREVRKHAGMMVPGPVQAAMTAALRDDTHADEQRARYRA